MKKIILMVAVSVLGCETKGAPSFEPRKHSGDEVVYFFEEPVVSGSGEGGVSPRNPWLDGPAGATGGSLGSGSSSGAASGGSAGERPPETGSGGEVGEPEPPKPAPVVFFAGYEETVSAHKYLTFENAGRATSSGECEVWVYSNGGIEAGRKIGIPPIEEAASAVVCTTGAPNGPCDEALGSAPFNGDDALVIRCLGVPVDTFGRVGEDPGSEWKEGAIGTKDAMLVRCERVVRAPEEPFQLAREWAAWAPGLDLEAARQSACPVPAGVGGATSVSP